MSKSTTRFILRALFIGVFLWLFYYLLHKQQLGFRDLARLSPQLVSAWVILHMISWILNSEKLRVLLRPQQIFLTFQESLELSMASSLFNYLPLQAGAAARGAYLLRRYQVSPLRFAVLTLVTYLVMIAAQGSAAIILILLSPKNRATWILFWSFLPAAAFAAWPLVTKKIRLGPAFFFRNKIPFYNTLQQEFEKLVSVRQTLLFLGILEVLYLVVEASKLYLCFLMLFPKIVPTWRVTLLISSLAIPSVLLNITPAGLGVRESAISFTAKAYRLPLSKVFVVAGLDRLLTMIMTFTLGSLAAWRLTRPMPLKESTPAPGPA